MTDNDAPLVDSHPNIDVSVSTFGDVALENPNPGYHGPYYLTPDEARALGHKLLETADEADAYLNPRHAEDDHQTDLYLEDR